MKYFIPAVIFLLFLHQLPVKSLDEKIIAGEPSCYVYVSISKDKKISVFKLDADRETLNLIGEEPLPGEPGSLCIDPFHKTMYASLRSSRSIASLNFNRKTGLIKYMKDTPVADNPVYISTDLTGKFLLFSSYSGNINAVYPLRKGSVVQNAVYLSEARINPHMIKTDPSGRFVFVPNLGGDLVQQFILLENGSLKTNTPDAVSVKSKSGPRHFIFHPIKNIFYLVNERGCTIMPFHFDPAHGTLSGPFQEISTLPAGYTSTNTCADIHITPDGKFVYASNRGHNSLAGFSVNSENGTLNPLGHFPTEKIPREFEIDPSGKFIISAGEGSGKIALYRIEKDGKLLLLNTIEVGSWPVWVTIVRP